MIRDPSDGTTFDIAPQSNDINEITAKMSHLGITSGLPETSTKLDYLERLEASREWLRGYNAFKAARDDGTAQSREAAVNE